MGARDIRNESREYGETRETYSWELEFERSVREESPSMESFASNVLRNPERLVPWLTGGMYKEYPKENERVIKK